MLIRGGHGVPIQFKLEHGWSRSWRKESKASCQQVSGKPGKDKEHLFTPHLAKLVTWCHPTTTTDLESAILHLSERGQVGQFANISHDYHTNTIRTQCLVIKTFLVLLGVGGGPGREVVYCYSFFFSMLFCLISVWLCVVFIAF